MRCVLLHATSFSETNHQKCKNSHNPRSNNSTKKHSSPSYPHAHFPTSHGQKWFVHNINIPIKNLIDAHNKCIPQQQCYHTYRSAGEHETPVTGNRSRCIDQCSYSSSNGSQDGTTDGMGTGEFVEGSKFGSERSGLNFCDGAVYGVWIKVTFYRGKT